MSVDLEHLRGWIGRTESLHDSATLAPLCALSAMLDREGAEGPADVAIVGDEATVAAGIRRVATARVQREYPSSLRITIAERVPVVVISGGPRTTMRSERFHLHHTVRNKNLQQELFARATEAAVVAAVLPAGPPPMIEALQEMLMVRMQVPFGQIHFDRFI